MICAGCKKDVPKSEIKTVKVNGEEPLDYCGKCLAQIKEKIKNYKKGK